MILCPIFRSLLVLPLAVAGGAAHAQTGEPDSPATDQAAGFRPFRNESDARMLGDLAVENRIDRIALYGSLVITRDKEGLALAQSLKRVVDATVDRLQAGALPDRIRTRPADTVASPFADD